MKTILSHANLIDCVEPKVRPDSAVLIENGRIRAILPSGEVGSAGDAQMIDLKSGYLMPGLWDVHIHPDYLTLDEMPLADQVTLFGHRLAAALTESGIVILIVVDKLLTGFDAPRNTVLYLAAERKEHNLLQAIARVNRVFDDDGAREKPFGYVIDYCGVLQHLGDALTANDALKGFDESDLNRAVISIADEARTLPQKHAALLDLFAAVSNKYDEEAYARALSHDELRDEFYRLLSSFKRTLTVAVASQSFVEETPPERLARWKADEKRFIAPRAHVKTRYADTIDGRCAFLQGRC
jgi:hypothetical protein